LIRHALIISLVTFLVFPAMGVPLVKTQEHPQVGFEFGIASFAFRDKSLDELVQCAQQVGIRRLALKSNHLPLNATDEQIAEVLKKTRAAGLEVYAGGVIYMKNKAQVEQAFDYAQRAKMQMIVGVPNPELLDLVEQKVKETGVKIAIHIHGNRKNLYPDAESVYTLIEDRDPGVGICVDVGHTIRLNQDPAAAIRQYADRVLDIQLWDSSSASHEGGAILAGYGVMDLRDVMQALIDIQYTGTVALEFWKARKTPQYGTAQTLGYLQGIMSMLPVDEASLLNNQLTDAERAEGWELLFDGKTTEGWRGVNRADFPGDGWEIKDGAFYCTAKDGAESGNGGDLVTVDKYSDFELSFEWKMLDAGGNSGVKYFVVEGLGDNPKHGIGLEYQVLDDANHPWMLEGKMAPGDYRTVSSLYELYTAKNKKLKPLGQYNQSRILSKGSRVEHWLNGIKVLSYERGSKDFKERVAKSKMKKYENFGEATQGHILLQDHGGRVYYRNIKIRTF